MSDELETAGLASAGALSAGGTADLQGQPCRNCGTQVDERYCPQCGQLAASFHRPVISLVAETISDSLALDGRIARTLPRLLFRPGSLSRDYSEGKRSRYVPPFRLFLLSSLLFYLVVFAFVESSGIVSNIDLVRQGEARALNAEERAAVVEFITQNGKVDDEELEAFLEGLRGIDVDEGLTEEARDVAEENGVEPEPAEAGTAEPADTGDGAEVDADVAEVGEEISNAAERILENPRLFLAAIENWAPRLSLLLVPLTILALSLIYSWRRRIYIYDHAIHALHLHSWMYLASTAAIGLSALVGSWVAAFYFLAIPVYTTLSLRGAYGTGIFSAFLRMLFLIFFWLVCLLSLVVTIFVISALSV